MPNTVESMTFGPIIPHDEYSGLTLPSNATLIGVKKNGVAIGYVLHGRPGNYRVSGGGDWANSTISVEYSIP